MKREGDPTEEEALKDLGNPADSSEKNNPETGGEKGMSDNPKDEEDALLRALGKAQKRPAEAGTKKLTKAEDKLLSELGKPKKEGEISDAARRIREKREEIREQREGRIRERISQRRQELRRIRTKDSEQEIALAKKTGRRKAREGREQPVEEATNLQEYILYAFDDGEHTLLDVSGLNPQERNAKTQAYEAGIVHTRKFLKERVSMTEEEARFWEESEPIREELMSFWEEFRRADTEEEAREKLGKVRDVLGRLDQLREEIFGSKYISSSHVKTIMGMKDPWEDPFPENYADYLRNQKTFEGFRANDPRFEMGRSVTIPDPPRGFIQEGWRVIDFDGKHDSYRVAKKRPAIKQEQDIAPSEFGGAVARLSGIEFDWQIRPGKKSGSVTLARMLTEGLKKPKEELKQISSKDLEAVRIHMSDKTVWKIKFDKKSGFKLHRRVPGAQVVQNIDRKTLEDFQRQQRELVIEANEKRRRIIEKHIEKPAIDEEEEDRLLRELGSIGKKF